jgi:ribose/xylose/arabinose/galactoside ABC-type transport system permease subunit
MQAYLEKPKSGERNDWLITLLLFALGVGALIVAEQILTGWLPLGERANIPRSDLNWIEWAVIISCAIYGVATLWAARLLFLNKPISACWSQWMTFFTLIVGVTLIVSYLDPLVIHKITGAQSVRNAVENQGYIGVVLAILGGVSYAHVRRKSEESSDDLRRATRLTPGTFIRVQLAKSPSAGAIIGFIAIFLIFSFATDLFLEPTSVASILTNVSSKGIMAIGVTILMISGEFDLSVGSILGVVAMSFMTFMTEGIPGLDTGPIPEFWAAILALGVALVLGLINGLILVTTKIPSFIVTLGTLLAYRAVTLVVIAGGRILRYRDYFDSFPVVSIEPIIFAFLAVIGLAIVLFLAYMAIPNLWRRALELVRSRKPESPNNVAIISSGLAAFAITAVFVIFAIWLILVAILHFGNSETIHVGFFDIASGRWETGIFSDVTGGRFSIDMPRDANFRMAIVWWLVFVAVFHIILTRTRYGNSVFAVGGNVGAARAQGINVNRIKMQNFVLVALLTGVAAIYETARNPGVDPLKGEGWELDVIAMTVIGGALLSGGYGSILGSLLGALIFGMLQTGLVLVGMDSRLFNGTVGVIIIVAVVMNTFVRGKQTR